MTDGVAIPLRRAPATSPIGTRLFVVPTEVVWAAPGEWWPFTADAAEMLGWREEHGMRALCGERTTQ